MNLTDQVVALCEETASSFPEPLASQARALGRRLAGPLRIAVAGRVKAGKSTLLNALVGERLAPTDAGECTRIVTWYEEASGYEVDAELPDGSRRSVTFRRNGALQVDLEELRSDQVASLRVGWPSRRLHDMTLIDTPGLASVHGENSARTEDFLTTHDERSGSVDAVLYLLRHVHRRDVEFLDAFMDRRVIHASPANAIAVLSRADEIGGGRLDSLESARRIAGRYRSDHQIRGLVDTVVPVAGLLAETGTTLREDEYAALRLIANEPETVLDALLVTADRFVEPSIGPLTIELRRDLLDRLGLFGVRFAVDCIRSGQAASAAELSDQLVAASGLRELEATIRERFLPRARVLQARSVLAGLRSLAAAGRGEWPERAAWLDSAVERIEAGAAEVAAVRLLHLVLAGGTRLTDDEVAEVRRLVTEGDDRRRLGLAGACTDDDVRTAAGAAAGRWHARAGDPLADPATIEARELAARVLEQVYARS